MRDRPKAVLAIFVLTVLKLVIAWTFVAVSQFRDLPVSPELLLYTATAYTMIAIPTFLFIHSRNALGVRACLIAALLASVPAVAVIAIVLDLAALALSFRAPARQFFAASAT